MGCIIMLNRSSYHPSVRVDDGMGMYMYCSKGPSIHCLYTGISRLAPILKTVIFGFFNYVLISLCQSEFILL